VFGDQGGAGRKDGGKGEEQASYYRAEFFSHDAGGSRDKSSEEEADCVLARFGGFQGGEVGLDAHRRNSA
jgi:hypothetical protein